MGWGEKVKLHVHHVLYVTPKGVLPLTSCHASATLECA